MTVDKGDKDWKGKEGFVPAVLKEIATELGFDDDAIITSLERRMSCGKCGRCNVGSKYVCKDGLVFTLRQINQMHENVLS